MRCIVAVCVVHCAGVCGALRWCAVHCGSVCGALWWCVVHCGGVCVVHCGGVCGALQHNNIKLQHARPQHCEIEGRDTHIPDGDGELAEVVHKQVGVRVRLFEAPVEVVFNDTTPHQPHHTTPHQTTPTTPHYGSHLRR